MKKIRLLRQKHVLTAVLMAGALGLLNPVLGQGGATLGVSSSPDDSGDTKAGVSLQGKGTVKPFGLGLTIGSVVRTDPDTGETKTWNQIRLQPELTFGKFGVGVDVGIEWDQQNKLNQEDWDDATDILDKILYVRYGKKGKDPFSIRAGGLDNSTLGHGLLMSRFSNRTFWPDVKMLGLDVAVDTKMIGVEAIAENLEDGEIVATRLSIKPLSAGSGFFSKLGIAASMALDRHVGVAKFYPGFEDDRVVIYGADQELPLIDNSIVRVVQTFDWAHIRNYGTGYAGGFMGKLAFIDYKLEYRTMEGDFIPSYFDNFYQAERTAKRLALATANPDARLNGFFGVIGANIGGYLKLGATYEEYTSGGPADNRFVGTAEVPKGVIPKMALKGTYTKNHIVGLKDFFKVKDLEALYHGEVSYEVAKNVQAVYMFTRRYELVTDNVPLQTIDSSTVEMRVKF